MKVIASNSARCPTLHGFSVNLAPDLSHFGGIVPCGLADFAVTSAEALGKPSAEAARKTARRALLRLAEEMNRAAR